MNRERIAREVERLGPWFHNLELGGVATAPSHALGDYPRQKFARFQHAIPKDLHGCTVLDIGCNGGFYCIEMKRRGADRVVGIDFDDACLAQARFAADVTGVPIELHRMSVYEVKELEERFDIVLFMGLLHHLRHPLLALDLIHDHVVGGTLVFQSMLRGVPDVGPVEDDYPRSERTVFDRPSFPKLNFVEKRYAGDPTSWWIPNRACAEAMLRSAGFRIKERPEDEVYICERAGAAGRREESAR
ncbi:MAG TPA: TIGR04290 family methyltransferase [Labilithrix sp.]|nr:TIGR04290 family methyltransferase [Labilithrix sp.]